MNGAYLRCVNFVRNLVPMRLEHWQDPRVFYRNAEEHHVPLRLVGSKEEGVEVVKAARGETEWVRFIAQNDKPSSCLFKLYPNPKSCPVELVTGEDAAVFEGWMDMVIPSNWQMIIPEQDPPIYTNITYPWKRYGGLSTYVPTNDNPTGCYRINFDIPANWIEAVESKSREVFLTLHGAGAGVDIFVNGKYIGYGQDSMTETEVNITAADLKTDENHLTLIVYRWTDGSYMEDQDQWWLSGVFRDVELSCRPLKAGIQDYIVEADMDGHGHVTVKLSGEAEAGNDCLVRAILFDETGKEVLSRETEAVPIDFYSKVCLGGEISFEVPNVNVWDVQRPYLYTLILQSVRNDVVIQTEATRVGFRSVCIRDAQVCVNSEPILVCGVNRHEWDQHKGKVITEELMIKDIKLMKQFNFNAVRNCHYPNTHRWYELCDEYGLFMIDEANIETHGFSKIVHMSLLQNDPNWRDAIMSRIQAMVKRSRNRPCIIGWSLGNESGCGPNIRNAAKWIRSMDSTRTVQYEGGSATGNDPMMMGDGRDPCTDIICPMYDSPKAIVEIEMETVAPSGLNRPRPLILCEYAHAMGNSSGNLHQYWQLFRSKDHPKLQGGFIWDFVDQGLIAKSFLEETWGYGGDFGPTSGKEDSTFCINGMVFPDRTPHPAMHEAKYLMQPMTLRFDKESVNISVEFFPHAPRDEIEFEYKLFDVTKEAPLASGSLDYPEQKEPGSDLFHMQMNKSMIQKTANAEFLVVLAVLKVDTKYAKKGHIVASETFYLGTNESPIRAPKELQAKGIDGGQKVNVSLKDQFVTISGETYETTFNIVEGTLESLASEKEEFILPKGLAHCFYRAPTDNDVGGLDTMLPYDFLKWFVTQSQRSLNGQWVRAGITDMTRTVVKVDLGKDLAVDFVEPVSQFTIAVREEFKKNNAVKFSTITEYTFTPFEVLLNLHVKAASSVTKNPYTIPRIGMELMMPSQFQKVHYLGRGPHECYPDRKTSARFGVYSDNVSDMHIPYIMPSENGGRTDVSWVEMESSQTGQKLRIEYAFSDDVQKEWFFGTDKANPTNDPGPYPRPADMQGAQFSASRYTPQQLAEARHQVELPQITDETPVYVHIDHAMCGLGGDVSWFPKLHKQYRVRGSSWSYQLKLSIE